MSVMQWSLLRKSLPQGSSRSVHQNLSCCRHVVDMKGRCITCRLLEHEPGELSTFERYMLVVFWLRWQLLSTAWLDLLPLSIISAPGEGCRSAADGPSRAQSETKAFARLPWPIFRACGHVGVGRFCFILLHLQIIDT